MAALEELEEIIGEGERSTSKRLPPERVLAARLGISRSELRQTLARLESEGRIWRHVGRGTFVGERPAAPLDAMPQITRMTNPSEVMEVRLIIEPPTARLAALHATPDDIAFMEHCTRRGGTAGDTGTFEHWDGALHRRIAQAARNNFLLAIFDVVNGVRRDELWGRLKEATLTHRRRAAYGRQHDALVALIRDRDAAGAEAAMREHLETVKRHLMHA